MPRGHAVLQVALSGPEVAGSGSGVSHSSLTDLGE